MGGALTHTDIMLALYLVPQREHVVDLAGLDIDLYHGVVFLCGKTTCKSCFEGAFTLKPVKALDLPIRS